jgi:Spy/CpxP family protein refolding chaperone
MTRFLAAAALIGAMTASLAAQAQPATPAGKKYVALLAGQQILYSCGTVMTDEIQSRLETALSDAGEAQTEITREESDSLAKQIRAGFEQRANRGQVCAQIKDAGAEAYVDQLLK